MGRYLTPRRARGISTMMIRALKITLASTALCALCRPMMLSLASAGSLRLHCRERVGEGHGPDHHPLRPATAPELVMVAQQLLVLLDLLCNGIEGGFDGSRCRRAAPLGRHLARWQSQVERHHHPLACGAVFDKPFQVHKVGTEYPEISAQLFYLLVD